MPHETNRDRIILDPLSENSENRPLELTGRDAGHGVYLVEHDYPVPERKTNYVGSARSVGERKVAPGLPENRTIPVKLWAAEEGGIGASYNLIPNPSLETNTTGWVGGTSGATITRDSTRARHGEYSLRVEGKEGEVWSAFSPNVAVTAGFGYRVVAWIYVTDPMPYQVLLYAGVSIVTVIQNLTPGWNLVTGTGISPISSAGAAVFFRSEEFDASTYWIDSVAVIPYFPSAAEVADGMNLAAFWPLDSASGLNDVSGNARHSTAQGGLVVGNAWDGPADSDSSTIFDGTNDYVQTNYGTRRNLCPNPSFETNTTFWNMGWGGGSGHSLTRTNAWARSGSWSCRAQGTGAAVGIGAYLTTGLPVTAGVTYTISCRVRGRIAGTFDLQSLDYSGGVDHYVTGTAVVLGAGQEADISVTTTIGAGNTVLTPIIRQVTTGTVDFDFDAVLIEQTAAVDTYFDGSSAFVGSGFDYGAAGLEVGWLGTAHASASDRGCFANGTKRTIFGWTYRDTAGDEILFGSDVGPSGRYAYLAVTAAGAVVFRPHDLMGGPSWGGAFTAVGSWVHWAIMLDEAADSATLYINGVSQGAQACAGLWEGRYPQLGTSATGGHGYLGGKMAHVGVAERELTAAEIGLVMGITNPADETPPAEYLDGDTPGCVWGSTAHGSGSYRRATGGKRFTAILSDLEEKIEKMAREGGTYKRTLPSGDSITFDVKEARIDIASARAAFAQGRAEVDLEFVCDPLGRGPEVAIGADTAITGAPATSPVLTATLPSALVPGTYGARGRLVLDNDVAFDQAFLAWGIESRYFDKADPATKKLLLDSSDITALGSATKVAGPTGAFGSGNNVIREGALGGSPAAFASTQLTGGGSHLEHVGAYRVWARVYRPTTNTGAVKVWLEWSQGDFRSYRKNAVKSWAANESEATWQMIPLGIVRIPPATAGTQKWEGRLIATSTQDGDDLDLDWIWLQPITEGSGRATAQSTAAAPSTFIVQDSFTRAGSLTGSAPNKGSTWAVVTTSDANDFAVLGTANRADTLDTTLLRGRLVSVGAASYASTRMKCEVTWSALPTTAGSVQAGMFCRMVDIDNHVKVVMTTVGGLAVVKLIRVITLLGGASDLAAVTVGPSYTVTGAWNIEAEITVGGAWRLWVNNALVASGFDAQLSASGGLATGRVGLIDVNTSSQSLTRYIGDFAAWQPVSDAAAFASQSAEIRHDSAIREDSAGALWTPISNYRGDFLLIPPKGREKRGLRWTAKLARTDAEQADNDRDAASGQLYVTPLYDVVPETSIL